MNSAGLTVPSTALDQVLELPEAISPTMAGVLVGLVTAVIVFTVFAIVILKRTKRPTEPSSLRASANDVVFIPPYSAALPAPARVPSFPSAPPPPRHAPSGQNFVPSSALSARAFAKMGFAFGERIPGAPLEPMEEIWEAPHAPPSNRAPHPHPPPPSVRPPFIAQTPPEVDRLRALAAETGPASAVSIAAAVAVATTPARSEIPPPAPAPNAGARIDDLSFDDGPTQFCEPFFDEPPQPPTRGSRPKIRKITPSAPRFPAQTPVVPDAAPTRPQFPEV